MNAPERFDYQQQMDQQERDERALQALMRIQAAGLTEEADTLAAECGLFSQWKAPVKVRREFEARQDGLPF